MREIDILDRLDDLHKQATTERSHFYVAKCVMDAAAEIINLRAENAEMKFKLREAAHLAMLKAQEEATGQEVSSDPSLGR